MLLSVCNFRRTLIILVVLSASPSDKSWSTSTSLPSSGEAVVEKIPRKLRHERFCSSPVRSRQQWNERKKIISYSLFETADNDLFQWYFSGMLDNIIAARLYYPDWIVRIHVFNVSEAAIGEMLSNDMVEVVHCFHSEMSLSTSRKMISRFLPYDDPHVEYIISPDADSRLNPRELFAVNEWMSSGLGFHNMRDHEFHGITVLGGMFGMQRGVLDDANASMVNLISRAFSENPVTIHVDGEPGEDQSFLAQYVWPHVKSKSLSHDDDAERCKKYGARVCKSFPIPRRSQGFFVGDAIRSKEVGRHPSSCEYNCSVECSLVFRD